MQSPTKSSDNHADDQRTDRKASAASADDEAMFEVTPFGRRRKPTQGRALMSWIVHIIGFPFFYIHNRAPEETWADEGAEVVGQPWSSRS